MDPEILITFANTIEPAQILSGLLNAPAKHINRLMVGAHNVDHDSFNDSVDAEDIPKDEQCDPMDKECQEFFSEDTVHWVQRLIYSREEEQKKCSMKDADGEPMYPKYNYNYFDEYCADYVLCKVNYDAQCMPVDAVGFDAQQTRQLEAFIIGIPTYIIYILIGLLVTPMVSCGYLRNWDAAWISTCSLGVIPNQTTS